jgi:hypothetical protein
MEEIKLGKWKHFKGHTVEVVAMAKNSENYSSISSMLVMK